MVTSSVSFKMTNVEKITVPFKAKFTSDSGTLFILYSSLVLGWAQVRNHGALRIQRNQLLSFLHPSRVWKGKERKVDHLDSRNVLDLPSQRQSPEVCTSKTGRKPVSHQQPAQMKLFFMMNLIYGLSYNLSLAVGKLRNEGLLLRLHLIQTLQFHSISIQLSLFLVQHIVQIHHFLFPVFWFALPFISLA